MIATYGYGLRNHEVFFCDYQDLRQSDPEGRIAALERPKRVCTICGPSIQSGARFDLRQGTLPPINTDLAQRIGQQVAIQFQRYEVLFSRYDLRAWAVRTIHFGLPNPVAARMMGHSVAIHNCTYHRWITHRAQRAAVQRGTWQPPL